MRKGVGEELAALRLLPVRTAASVFVRLHTVLDRRVDDAFRSIFKLAECTRMLGSDAPNAQRLGGFKIRRPGPYVSVGAPAAQKSQRRLD